MIQNAEPHALLLQESVKPQARKLSSQIAKLADASQVMKKPSRHRQIPSELLTEILAGKHDHTNRLPSEAQLVKRFKVSRPTVARALLDLKTKGILERRAVSGTCLCKDRDASPAFRERGLIVPGLGKIEIFDVICGELASLLLTPRLVVRESCGAYIAR